MKPRFWGITLTIITCLSLFFTGPLLATIDKDNHADAIEFGVAPTADPDEMVKIWGPVVRYLSLKTGIKMRLKIAPSIETFEKQLGEGSVDMVYINPYQYTTFNKIQGYVAFAKEKDKKVSGIIVVRKDSPYNTLADLKNQTLVFPQQDTFAASLLPRAKLKEEAIAHKSNYVSSPNSVYRAVYKGNIPAGGGVMQTYSKLNPVVNSKLRVLWKTKQYTPNAFAYHPRIPKSKMEKIQAAMTGMHHDSRGAMLLNTIKFNSIETAKDADWNDIRELQINLTQ